MVRCKFYMQGYCKFGDYCKFEHDNPVSDTHNAQKSTSILRQPHFAPSYQQQQAPKSALQEKPVDANPIIQAVVNDMICAEKGGQWLLSSYAPFKNKVAFPAFDDHSFEEIRLGYYEARKNGTLEQYKQQIQMLFHETLLKMKALQNPSTDLIMMITQVYRAPSPSQQQPDGSIFGGSTTSFIQNQHSDSAGTSLFRQASQNLFSNTTQSQPVQSNIFGTGQQGSSIFGQHGTAQSGGSIFGAQPVQGTPIFGASSFNQPTASQSPLAPHGTFGASLQQQPPPVFDSAQGSHQQSPIFGFANTSNVSFTNIAEANKFGSTAIPPFGQQPNFEFANTTNMQPHTVNMFGGTLQGQSVHQSAADEELYSKPENLTDDEKTFFKSEEWNLNNIPEKPPTYEMCFQV